MLINDLYIVKELPIFKCIVFYGSLLFFVSAFSEKTIFDQGALSLTFDDGYLDFYQNAFQGQKVERGSFSRM